MKTFFLHAILLLRRKPYRLWLKNTYTHCCIGVFCCLSKAGVSGFFRLFLINIWIKEEHHTYPVRDYIIVYSNKKDYGVSNLKLQKLLYFVQAFFLINDCPPCFDEKIEAWDFGPVVPEIYREYKRYGGMDIPTIDYYVKFDKKNIWNTERIYYEDIISDDDKEMIQAVVDKFAYCSATFLVNLTHNQDPWINAYVNGQRNEITKEDIKRYFDD